MYDGVSILLQSTSWWHFLIPKLLFLDFAGMCLKLIMLDVYGIVQKGDTQVIAFGDKRVGIKNTFVRKCAVIPSVFVTQSLTLENKVSIASLLASLLKSKNPSFIPFWIFSVLVYQIIWARIVMTLTFVQNYDPATFEMSTISFTLAVEDLNLDGSSIVYCALRVQRLRGTRS